MSALIEGVFRRLLSRPARDPALLAPQDPAEMRADPRRPVTGSALLEWIDETDTERAQAVHLVNRSEGGLAVRSATVLDAGWPVLVTLPNGAPVKAVVRHRRRDSSGWLLGLQLIRRERRRFDRRPLDRLVEVAWDGADGRRQTADGRVRDVGEGGLQFVSRANVPTRSFVVLSIDGWQRFGTIVHQRADGDLVVYGVQFAGPPILKQGVDFDE
ncbi:MAG: PilZ domain-containing protein [Acidobacteria bacterium]|nr:PilZ domain-containing protein [Acidobacteriota bacterium]